MSGPSNRCLMAGDLNDFAVHHAVVGATAGAAADGEPRPGQRRENFCVVWELGQNATMYPDVPGVKLAAGLALNFELHAHAIGTEATITIDVAFKLRPRGVVPKDTNNTMFDSLTYHLDIPGNRETVISALYPMTRPGMVLSFEPRFPVRRSTTGRNRSARPSLRSRVRSTRCTRRRRSTGRAVCRSLSGARDGW